MLVIIFILILSFLVLIHELGHMVVAKRAGVKVEEFGIGYPPKLITLFRDKAGTEYSLNLLPFGGFVRLLGEEIGEEGVSTTGKEFYLKSKKTRLIIIAAGVVINFLFGAVAFGAIYTKIGIPEPLGVVLVTEVAKNSPAEAAGIMPGDKIVGVYGDTFETETRDFITFASVTGQHAGEEIGVRFSGETGKYDAKVFVRREGEIPEGEGAIGVGMQDTELVFYPVWQRPFRGIWYGLKQAVVLGLFMLGFLWVMLRDLLALGVVPVEVAGPVGIGHAVVRDQLLTRDLISIANINFAAALSINLAIINLLPFPALDGGRAALILLEGVLRRRVKPKIERWVNTAGFVGILGLIIAVTYNDIRNLIIETGVVEQMVDFIGRIK